MSNKRFFSALYALLSSMRFAVSLMTLIAIASIIGTVLKQNEAYVNYQIEFGPFWFQVFERLGLYDVYHSGWFLFIFAFLVCSTSSCICRHFPGMLREMRSFRLQAKDVSLRLMPHHTDFPVPPAFSQKLDAYLMQAGYHFRKTKQEEVMLWAAKKGSLQKLGYFLAHIGIVVICVGGLIDGNIILKWQEIVGSKSAETRNLLAKDMPENSRLPPQNGAFRANISIPEDRAVDFAWISAGQGVFLQELPFILRLKAFRIAHYTTGQPKLFASEVVIQDKRTGKKTEATIQVNHPLIVDGVAIYQSGFGDGGSGLDIQSWHLGTENPSSQSFHATSLLKIPLVINDQTYRLEWGELRVFNIENMETSSSSRTITDESIFQEKLKELREVKSHRNLRNMGPSIQFKLRDAQGQTSEYLNYMQPFSEEGRYYLLSGVRKSIEENIRFIRLPLDSNMSIKTFLHLRAVLLNKKNIPIIAKRTADKALAEGGFSAHYYTQFTAITTLLLDRFQQGGFLSLEKFMDAANIPQDKRSAIAQTYIKILQAATIEAMQLAYEQAGEAILKATANHDRFLLDSLIATSHLFEYGAPVYLQLKGFQQVQSSGLLLTRAPGKKLVYIGCLLLVLGVMAMFYIREMRLWVRIQQGQALLAMSSNRKNQELDNIFYEHTQALRQLAQEA